MTAPQTAAILVVEDNVDNRIIYGTLLRSYGFLVREAETAEAAIEIVRSDPPDLVLMDIGLPRMDGVEATKRLKEDPVTATIPVLALTAHALFAERQRAAQAGVDAYLVKPVEFNALIKEIERALTMSAQRRGQQAASDTT